MTESRDLRHLNENLSTNSRESAQTLVVRAENLLLMGCFIANPIGRTDMKHLNHHTYLTEEETTRRLGISADELFLLVLESGRPSCTFEDGKPLYLKADIERICPDVWA